MIFMNNLSLVHNENKTHAKNTSIHLMRRKTKQEKEQVYAPGISKRVHANFPTVGFLLIDVFISKNGTDNPVCLFPQLKYNSF